MANQYNEVKAKGVKRETSFEVLTEHAARPLIHEKDPEVKEQAISKIASRLNREQDRIEKGFKPVSIAHPETEKIIQDIECDTLREALAALE